MMNKKILLVCCIAAGMLTGCGSDTKVIEGEVQTMGNGTAAEEAGAEGIEASGQVTGETDSQAAQTEASYKGYAFLYEGVAIEMDAAAEPIVEQLGESDFYFEAPSCAFEGIDKLYTYRSFELDTYPMNDKDYVSAIVFKDDMITTAEGVGIGDTEEKLTQTYGGGWTEENGMRVYEKDKMKLCFILEEERIISVEYHSTAGEE